MKVPDSPSMEKEEMESAPSPVGFREALVRRLLLRVVSSSVATVSPESVKVSSTELTVTFRVELTVAPTPSETVCVTSGTEPL